VIEAAECVDDAQGRGQPIGSLGGVLIGVKDIIDTADMPTENGTSVHAGRRPARDAACISALRDAGAIIMGKTVTTELASYYPGKTRNPHNAECTPGGSSSGSAAAVAAGMCHAALGTQTNGSMIRPASFCGVYGFKPSFGLISRSGVLEQSPPLDTIGVFARSVEDIALVTQALTAYDAADPGMGQRVRAPMSDIAMTEPPSRPRFAFVGTPVWGEIEPETADAFEKFTSALGEACEPCALPGIFSDVIARQRTLMFADIAKNYGPLLDAAPDKISAKMASMIGEGRQISAVDYNRARDLQGVCRAALAPLFEKYDAILTPAAIGPAPRSLDATGNPVFCTIWTYCGVPAISLPLLTIGGMPVGVQLIGRFGDDARLLRTANWLARHSAHGA
jgi:Asp-tRNA(Asn)/Glu-tRNA(Gln) amidotransferase A subunit family amidase